MYEVPARILYGKNSDKPGKKRMMDPKLWSAFAFCLCTVYVSTQEQNAVLTWKIHQKTPGMDTVVMHFNESKLKDFAGCMCSDQTLACLVYAPPNGFVSFVENFPLSPTQVDLHIYTNSYTCEKVTNTPFVRCARLTRPPCEDVGACWSYHFYYHSWTCGVGHINVAWIFTQQLELIHKDNHVSTAISPCDLPCTLTSVSTTSRSTTTTSTAGSTPMVVSTSSIPGSTSSVPGTTHFVPGSTTTLRGEGVVNTSTAEFVKPEDSDDHSAIIIGVVIGLFVFVAFGLAAICILKHRGNTFKVIRNTIIQFLSRNATTEITSSNVDMRDGVQNQCPSETPTYDDRFSHLSPSRWDSSNSPVPDGEAADRERTSSYYNVKNGAVPKGDVSYYANTDAAATAAFGNREYEDCSNEGHKPTTSDGSARNAAQLEQTDFPGYAVISKQKKNAIVHSSDGQDTTAGVSSCNSNNNNNDTVLLSRTDSNFYEVPVVSSTGHISNRNPFLNIDAARCGANYSKPTEENIYFELNDFAHDKELDLPIPTEPPPSPPVRPASSLNNTIYTFAKPVNDCSEIPNTSSENSTMASETQSPDAAAAYVNTDFRTSHYIPMSRRAKNEVAELDTVSQERQSKQYFELEDETSISEMTDTASQEEPITLELDDNPYEDLDV